MRYRFFLITAVAIVYLVFLVWRLAHHNFDPSYFIGASVRHTDPKIVPQNIRIGQKGYDGQFYYRLALNPFTHQRTDYGIQLDNPAYRQQRIMYPLLVWLLSLGRPELIPFFMICVNYLALCAITWIGLRLVASNGEPEIWGLTLPLYAGFVLTLSRDLTEIVSTAFLLTALLALQRQKQVLAALALTFAALSRETTLVLAGALSFEFIYRAFRKEKAISPVVFLMPLLLYASWQLLLWKNWGTYFLFTNNGGARTLGLPFQGILTVVDTLQHFGFKRQVLWLYEVFVLFFFGLAVLSCMKNPNVTIYKKIGFLFCFVLASLLTKEIWIDDSAFLRATTEFYILGALVLISAKSRLRVPAFALLIILWIVLFTARI